MEDTDSFNDGQHGFRHCRSCLSQLMEYHHRILQLLESGSIADTIYINFAKAFDKVDHNILLRKLRMLRVGGSVLR